MVQHAQPTWQHHARCRPDHPGGTYDPELWQPVGTTGLALEQIEEAKTICWTQCPVRTECLNAALAHAEVGVWGGYSEDERREMRLADRGPRVQVMEVTGCRTS